MKPVQKRSLPLPTMESGLKWYSWYLWTMGNLN